MENIRIGRKDATDEEVMAAAKLANCEDFIEKMPQKWDTMIGENGYRTIRRRTPENLDSTSILKRCTNHPDGRSDGIFGCR